MAGLSGNLLLLVNHCRDALKIDKRVYRLEHLQPTVEESELYFMRTETTHERLWGLLKCDELMTIASSMSLSDVLSLFSSSRYICKQLTQMDGFSQLMFILVSKHCRSHTNYPNYNEILRASSTFIHEKIGIPTVYRETVLELIKTEQTTKIYNSIEKIVAYTQGLNFYRMVMVSSRSKQRFQTAHFTIRYISFLFY